jgi:ribonuclease BN (tRNA processing enzyme)
MAEDEERAFFTRIADISINQFNELNGILSKCSIGDNDKSSFLVVMKKWNSTFPKYPICHNPRYSDESDKEISYGGGFFLSINGYGLVIDPGYRFLDIFYENGFLPRDIKGIFISHCHDDHCIELEAIFSIFYKIHDSHPDLDAKFDLIINKTVFKKYERMIMNDLEYIIKKIYIFNGANNYSELEIPPIFSNGHEEFLNEKFRFNLSELGFEFNLINLKHTEIPWNIVGQEDLSKGCKIKINPSCSIYYSGDTKYSDELDFISEEYCKNYSNNDVLILNLGSFKGSNSDFPDTHLGYLGIHKILQKIKETNAYPNIIISELGFDLKDNKEEILQEIRKTYSKIFYTEPGIFFDLDNNPQLSRITFDLSNPKDFENRIEEIRNWNQFSFIFSLHPVNNINYFKENEALTILYNENDKINGVFHLDDKENYIPNAYAYKLDTNKLIKIRKITFTKMNRINIIDAIKSRKTNIEELQSYLQDNFIATDGKFYTFVEYETLTYNEVV